MQSISKKRSAKGHQQSLMTLFVVYGDERYADMSYVAGMGDAIKMLMNMGVLNNQGQCLAHAE